MGWLPDSPARAAGLVTALFALAAVSLMLPVGGAICSLPLVVAAFALTLVMAHKVTRNPKPNVGVLRSTRRTDRETGQSKVPEQDPGRANGS
jgi:hypothetical protein